MPPASPRGCILSLPPHILTHAIFAFTADDEEEEEDDDDDDDEDDDDDDDEYQDDEDEDDDGKAAMDEEEEDEDDDEHLDSDTAAARDSHPSFVCPISQDIMRRPVMLQDVRARVP